MTDIALGAILCGGYDLGNLGDDALMIAYYRVLRNALPDVRIGITSANQSGDPYIHKLVEDAHIIPRRPLVETRVTCDVELFGGGTQWYSFPGIIPVKSSTPKAVDILKHAEKILHKTKRLAKKRSDQRASPQEHVLARYNLEITATVQMAGGVGFGPFLVGGERNAIETVTKCRYIGVRDIVSLQYCQEWKILGAKLRSDICYLGELYGLVRQQSIRQPRGTIHIGVVVRDWPHTAEGNAYLAPLRFAVAQLRKKGYCVSYVVFSHLRDRHWIQMLMDADEEFLLWHPQSDTNITSFIQDLANFDLVISARYHGLVFASVLGIPTVAVEVEPKLSIAANTLGPACRLWSQPFDPNALLVLVTDILDDYQIRVESLRLSVESQRNLAMHMVDEIQFIAQRSVQSS